MQRVKEPDRFLFELERPPPGRPAIVTEADLERDASAFMAFAAIAGTSPGTRQAPLAGQEGVPSPEREAPGGS